MSRPARPEGWEWRPLMDTPPKQQKNDRVGLCLVVAAVALVAIWLVFAVWGWRQ